MRSTISRTDQLKVFSRMECDKQNVNCAHALNGHALTTTVAISCMHECSPGLLSGAQRFSVIQLLDTDTIYSQSTQHQLASYNFGHSL